jgi:hypothetical protein
MLYTHVINTLYASVKSTKPRYGHVDWTGTAIKNNSVCHSPHSRPRMRLAVTPLNLRQLRHGGVLQMVLHQMLKAD